jgi:mannose-1-phosphate guanylyltransferase
MLEPNALEWMERHPEVCDFSTRVLPQYIGRIATWHNADVHRDIGTLPSSRAVQSDRMPKHYWTVNDEWQAKF